MRPIRTEVVGGLLVCCLGLIGCASETGVDPPKMSAASHILPGTPQERIAKIQADPSLTDVEKQRRVAAIKSRNHLQ